MEFKCKKCLRNITNNLFLREDKFQLSFYFFKEILVSSRKNYCKFCLKNFIEELEYKLKEKIPILDETNPWLVFSAEVIFDDEFDKFLSNSDQRII